MGTYYVTKYALSKGIQKIETDEIFCSSLIRYYAPGSYTPQHFTLGRDIFDNFEAAKIQAEVMRQRKIITYQKGIRKMAALVFENPDG